MTQSEILADVIREFTVDFPTECVVGEHTFTGLKGFNTELGFRMMDSGYEDSRPEELHVLANQFTEENPPPEKTEEIVMDEDTFKVMKVEMFPNRKNPLFYKFTLILQS